MLSFLDSLDTYAAAPTPGAGPGGAVPPPPKATTTQASTSGPSPIPVKPKQIAQTTPLALRTAPSPAPAATPTNAAEAQSVLDFLDEITQRSSTPTAAVPPKPLAGSPAGARAAPGPISRSSSRSQLAQAAAAGIPARRSTDSQRAPASPSPRPVSSPAAGAADKAPEAAAGGGWGWGSVFATATAAVQVASSVAAQARTVAEEQLSSAQQHAAQYGGVSGVGEGLMKALGENEQAKKWGTGVMEYARGAHLDQLGSNLKETTLSRLNDLLNAVAPPIAEHEVIQVSLSHDMVGYDGVETLVYRALAKVMEQIEGGTLVLNKGAEEKRKEGAEADDERDLAYVEGLEAGWKLAEANIDQLIKTAYDPAAANPAQYDSSVTVPVTNCPIFLRIQPCLAPLPFHPGPTTPGSKDGHALFFLLLLKDPGHNLSHSSISQSIPAPWLDIPFEENEWVEDVMVDVIRRSTEIVGQEYVSGRMRAQGEAIARARAEAQRALFDRQEEEEREDRAGAGAGARAGAAVVGGSGSRVEPAGEAREEAVAPPAV